MGSKQSLGTLLREFGRLIVSVLGRHIAACFFPTLHEQVDKACFLISEASLRHSEALAWDCQPFFVLVQFQPNRERRDVFAVKTGELKGG